MVVTRPWKYSIPKKLNAELGRGTPRKLFVKPKGTLRAFEIMGVLSTVTAT